MRWLLFALVCWLVVSVPVAVVIGSLLDGSRVRPRAVRRSPEDHGPDGPTRGVQPPLGTQRPVA